MGSLAALVAVIMPASLAHAQQPPLHMTTAQQGLQAVSDTSRNWSGYAAQNGPYTKVSGTWKVPSVSGSEPSSAEATWVGIGGISSDDLIQSGTQNTVDDYGQVTTSGFYELLPDAPITIPTVTVHPGDAVSVSIAQQQPDQWRIAFADTSDGQKYSTTVSYSSSLSSAEWIEEAPSDGWSTVPLANFNSVAFTHSSTNQGTLAQSGAQPLAMVDDQAQPLATPSALGSDGASFSVSAQQPSSSGAAGSPWWSSPSPQQPGTDGGTPTTPWWWSSPSTQQPGTDGGNPVAPWWSDSGSGMGAW
jgi:hypothetical protein